MKKSTLFAIFAMAFLIFGFNQVGWGQTTYTWQGADNAAWNDGANWNPTRTTPSPTDILQFNDGTTKTVTAVPTETVGQMLLSNSTVINLQSAAAVTLTISGLTTGTDLDIPAGCALNLNAVNAITINIPTGSTGSISGSITFSSSASTAHRLTAADASAITFNSGASFTAGTNFSGNPFGTVNLNSIIFASGSTYIAQAGSNPFGAGQPNSVVVFQSGSLFKVIAGTPAFSGRTYANLEIDAPSLSLTTSGGSAVSINNLTITNGTLNFNMTATPGHSIKGNINVATGAVLNFAPATPGGTVNLNGSTAQAINNAGTITFGAFSTITVNNAAGITINSPLAFNNLTLTNGIVTNGANILTVNGNIIGGSSTSYINGKLAFLYSAAASKVFPIGKGGNYRPVTLTYTALDSPSTVTADQTESALTGTLPANITLFSNRFWTLTQVGATTFAYDITLDGTGFSPSGTARILKNDAGSITSHAATGTPPAFTATGLTSFSDFALGDYVIPTSALLVGTLSDFGDVCINSITGPSTFTITGSDLTNADVTVGPLEGYTYSTTAEGTYTPTLSFSQAGGAFSATVYVNFSPILVQSYNGNIPVGGGGSLSVNVAAAGSGINTPPSVNTTDQASLITETSATCEGDVTDGGCAIITARGICYGTAVDPDITGLKTTEPGTTGVFSSLIEGLIPATLYHFRAYVTSGSETTYGSDFTFTTLTFIAPTSQASNILFSSVTGTGLTADWTNGDGTNRVVIINTSNSFTNPSDGTDPVADPVYSGLGEQVVYNGNGSSVPVTGLSYNTEYWFRVYEYNGTASGTMFNTVEGVGNPASQATEPAATICGTKTVGIGGDYTTLTAAISDLNSKELCGALNLTLTDATYPDETFPIIINNNAGSSSTNTITIKPAIGVSPVITCNTYKSAIILNGSDYFIIDGSNQVGGSSKDLTITNSYTGDISNSVINFVDNGTRSATNSTIMNCIINGTPTGASSFGIYLNDDMGRYFENTSILNNTIKNAKIGIQIADANNNIISSNTIGDNAEPLKQGGIEMSFCDNTVITGNEIFGEVAGNPTELQYGISIGAFSTNTKILKNKIHDFYYTGSNGVACWGIKYSAEANSPTEISNNLIYNIKSDGDLVSGGNINWIPSGISIISGGNVQVYFNSINMTGNVLGTGPNNNFAGNSACFMINSAVTNLDIKNNIFKNSMTTESGTGANKTFGIVSYSENTAFADINYNNYYIDGLNPNIGYLSADMPALTDWQTATSNDANSVSSDPGFVSDTDLHPSLSGPNNTGITIPGISTDFAEATRSNPPDMGAYEYSILPTVITDAASNIDLSSAQLNGTVTADYASTDVSFEWGLTTSYGNTIAAIPATVDGGSATTVMATVIGLAENTTYHYRCIGVNAAGTTYGDDQSFLTVFTGIADNTTVQNLSAYPNPSHGQFTLSITSNKRVVYDLKILNALGIPVYNRKALEVNGTLNEAVNLPKLPRGVYSVVLNTDNRQIIRKIVVN